MFTQQWQFKNAHMRYAETDSMCLHNYSQLQLWLLII